MINGTGDDDNGAGKDDNDTGTYVLKAKKFAEPAFQSKKSCGKKCGSFLGHFGSFSGNFGPFWPCLGHCMAFLDKFAESSNFFGVAGLAFRMYVLVMMMVMNTIVVLWLRC